MLAQEQDYIRMNYRIYPTKAVSDYLFQDIGNQRFIRNQLVAINILQQGLKIFNTAGTAGIYACGDISHQMTDHRSRWISLKQETDVSSVHR